MRGEEQDAAGGEGVRAVPLPKTQVRDGELQGAGEKIAEQDGATLQHCYKTSYKVCLLIKHCYKTSYKVCLLIIWCSIQIVP